jgi:hypothetical protein
MRASHPCIDWTRMALKYPTRMVRASFSALRWHITGRSTNGSQDESRFFGATDLLRPACLLSARQ